jgi:hypothetical protein
MVRYYCIKHDPMIAFPQKPSLCSMKTYDGRQYIPSIDCMAYGWIVYGEELTPSEIATYGLIREPREDE